MRACDLGDCWLIRCVASLVLARCPVSFRFLLWLRSTLMVTFALLCRDISTVLHWKSTSDAAAAAAAAVAAGAGAAAPVSAPSSGLVPAAPPSVATSAVAGGKVHVSIEMPSGVAPQAHIEGVGVGEHKQQPQLHPPASPESKQSHAPSLSQEKHEAADIGASTSTGADEPLPTTA